MENDRIRSTRMVGDSLGYRDHAEVACGVLGYGGCGVVGVVMSSAQAKKDLKTLKKFDQKRFNAWCAFFNGARSTMKVFEGSEDRLFFGKAECEWVPSSFWTKELVDLGWVKIEDGEKRPALGMADLPEGRKPWVWDRTIRVTDRGWDVREADLEDFRQFMAKKK